MFADALVHDLDHHVMVEAVMTDKELQVFGLMLAEGAPERGLGRQFSAQFLHEVLVGRVTDELRAADERIVADGARDRHLLLLGLLRLVGGRRRGSRRRGRCGSGGRRRRRGDGCGMRKRLMLRRDGWEWGRVVLLRLHLLILLL